MIQSFFNSTTCWGIFNLSVLWGDISYPNVITLTTCHKGHIKFHWWHSSPWALLIQGLTLPIWRPWLHWGWGCCLASPLQSSHFPSAFPFGQIYISSESGALVLVRSILGAFWITLRWLPQGNGFYLSFLSCAQGLILLQPFMSFLSCLNHRVSRPRGLVRSLRWGSGKISQKIKESVFPLTHSVRSLSEHRMHRASGTRTSCWTAHAQSHSFT